MDNPENNDHKSLWDIQEDIKIKAILETIENEFLNGNSYSVWSAIGICNHYERVYPEWVTKELGRIAKRINALEKSGTGILYSDKIASILNMKGFARRKTDAERKNERIYHCCRIEIIEGKRRRMDAVNFIKGKMNSNTRQVEALYDKAKKEYEKEITSTND